MSLDQWDGVAEAKEAIWLEFGRDDVIVADGLASNGRELLGR